ncbi:MAG: hypothetical protein SF029_11755 [bacterium]|nr:hypothetical protein [bacterium]
MTLYNIATVYIRMRDYPRALEVARQGYEVDKGLGVDVGITSALIAAILAFMGAPFDQIVIHLKPALETGLAERNFTTLNDCMYCEFHLLMYAGRYEDSCEIIGLVLGSPLFNRDDPYAMVEIDAALETIRQHLSEDVIQAAIERGKTLDMLATAQALLAELS